MQAHRALFSLIAAVCALPMGVATEAIAQAPPAPPVLTADNDNKCGWGLGGAAAGLGAAAWMAPGMGGAPANWGGLYFGGHLGCMIGDTDWTFRNDTVFSAAGGRTSFDNSGLIAGGQIGYNWQFGQWVLGIEASLSGGEVADHKINALNPAPAVNSTKLTSDIKWLVQVTPRIGYTFAPRWHGYVKGGFASAEVDAVAFVANGAGVSSTSVGNARHNGWTIGAGLEYLAAPNLILGLDYSYIDLESNTRTLGCAGACPAPLANVTVDPNNIHMITGRISFKLGAEAARPAPLK
jgi:outer membrane immunogenic protein